MPLPGLRELRAELLDDHSLRGTAWCTRWAEAADAWIASLFESACRGESSGIALLAVGGHGRGVLAPGSDLDLVLVHEPKRRVRDLADSLWYPVWDSGVRLDHSVRTPKEVRALMDEDIKVALGLLDARLLAGNPELGTSVAGRARDLWNTRASKWLPVLDSLTRERHRRFGDLAFLLEPDLKEARGGLRDLQLLRTLAPVAPVLSSALGDPELDKAYEILTSVRVELQRPTTQSTNFLLLQDQDGVALALGYPDADALMYSVAAAARAIAWASDDAWRRLGSSLAGPRGRAGGGDRVVEPGVVVREGEVALATGADAAVDPSLAFRVAAASAEMDIPMARSTLDRLAVRALAPEGVWPPEVLHALLRLLGAGRPGIAAVEALDQRGIWLRYLPEWAAVRNLPQRNAYHRFTVDRHLLETAAGAAQLQSSVSRPDLLVLGALVHDIGKGGAEDHTKAGISIVGDLLPRLGLPEADCSLVVTLVRHHLLLPDSATRRDLDDPSTASFVASAVGDRSTLELLAALTEADSLATGPAAWGPWKAGLVSRLVNDVAALLEGQPPVGPSPLAPEEAGLLSAGGLQLLADGGRVTVAAWDKTGLLATVAGVLTLAGVTVRSASTVSDPATEMALLRFEVAPAFDDLPSWPEVRSQLAAALDGHLSLDALLEEREARYSRFRPVRSALVPDVRVMVDNEASATSTVVEVRAPDRGPVLYRVARALSTCGVNITSALVSTLGAEAVDVFYVDRVEDPAHMATLKVSVLGALGAYSAPSM